LPPELYELIGSADLVVAGTIIEVQETHFVLRFDEVLAGQAEAKVVVVRKFVDWACATRSKPYAVGQKEVAFLIRPDSRRPSVGEDFILMSAGAEAEWEIFGDTVVATGYPIDGYDAAPAGQAGQELPLKAVLNAIRRYRTCFAVEGWFGAGHRSIEQICDEKKLRAYRAGSPFHRHLVAISEVAIKAQSSSAEKSTPTAHER